MTRTVAVMDSTTTTNRHTTIEQGTAMNEDRAVTNAARAHVTEYATVGNSLMTMTRQLPRRLLGIWAHPDDEAYLSAGLMARVIAAGGNVTLVTATRGEKGTDDPARFDHPEFAAFRERELEASLAELGVSDLRMLDLRDGECDLADDDAATGDLVRVMREVHPDAVVTFGPDGITNHPDHRAVSRWTTEAWRRVRSGELLYATMTHDYIAQHRKMHDELGIFAEFGPAGPASVQRSRVALECALTDFELARKRNALAAHASQTAGLAELMGEDTYRNWWRNERFRRPTVGEMARCAVPTWMQHDPRARETARSSVVPARESIGAGR